MFYKKNNPILHLAKLIERLVDAVKILHNKMDHLIKYDDELGETLNVQQRHVIQRLTNLEEATAWMKDWRKEPIQVKSSRIENRLDKMEAKVNKIDSAMENYLYILTKIKKILGDQFTTQQDIVSSLLERNGRLREEQQDAPVVMPPEATLKPVEQVLDPETDGAALLAQPLINQQHKSGKGLRTVEEMLLNCLKWRSSSVASLLAKDLERFRPAELLAALLEMVRQRKHPIACKINVSTVQGVTARRLIFGFSQRIAPAARLPYKKAVKFQESLVEKGTYEARTGGDSPNQSYRSVRKELEETYPNLRNKTWS